MASQCNGNKKKFTTFLYNFNEKWENEYFFINANNKCVCLICNTSVAVNKKCNTERHFMTMHKDYIGLHADQILPKLTASQKRLPRPVLSYLTK
jgi:hypothetical protein